MTCDRRQVEEQGGDITTRRIRLLETSAAHDPISAAAATAGGGSPVCVLIKAAHATPGGN